jgi:hypothetical protein
MAIEGVPEHSTVRARRDMLVSKGWIQAVALVVLFGFFVMGLLPTGRIRKKHPFRAVLWDRMAPSSLRAPIFWRVNRSS